MNNKEIFALMKARLETRHILYNVYALDTLPDEFPTDAQRPSAFIVNTAKASELGRHWVVCFFPRQGMPEFFDSFGGMPHRVFVNFMKMPFRKNNRFIQNPLTTTCGQYCMYFVFLRGGLNVSMDLVIETLVQQEDFSDIYVNNFIERTFQTDLDVQDLEFIEKRL